MKIGGSGPPPPPPDKVAGIVASLKTDTGLRSLLASDFSKAIARFGLTSAEISKLRAELRRLKIGKG